MNRMYVTAADGKVYHERDEVLSAWNDGHVFRAYGGYPVCAHDRFRMQMAGFTHVCFIWQRRDLSVDHYDLELTGKVH